MNWWLHPMPALQALHALRHDWDRLNRDNANTPLLASAFILPLLKNFTTGKEVLACLGSSGRLRAMLLLSPQGQGRWQTFQPSQAPLGAFVHHPDLDWLDSLHNLFATLPGLASILGITQQDPEFEKRPCDTATVQTLDYIRTARIVLPDSFETYWEARGKNLKLNLKKQRNRLTKEGIGTYLQIDSTVNAVRQAIVDYGQLESTGWKAQHGSAVHADNVQGLFYRELLENFCRLGKGRIYRYWYNDRLVAMDLCVEGNGRLIILKTAYDEAAAGVTSPALLMRQEAIARIFSEPHITHIEFYGRVLEWHTRWTDDIRTMYHCNLYRWQIVRALRDLIRRRKAGHVEATHSQALAPADAARCNDNNDTKDSS